MFLPCRLTADQFIAKHKIQADALENDPVIRDVHRVYVHIDTKSSSLLTHVSLMVAVCTFFYSSGNANVCANRFLLFEAVGYMVIALILLFCLGLSMYKAPEEIDALRAYYARSCQVRTSAYLFALTLTKFLTVAVLLTIAYRLAL